jgi:hypothetical protein
VYIFSKSAFGMWMKGMPGSIITFLAFIEIEIETPLI